MNIFLICPVRNATLEQKQAMEEYVLGLERAGHKVHWPPRDTNQVDSTGGYRICRDNTDAIRQADEVHVWWSSGSVGSIFDFGASFILHKPIRIANPDAVKPTEGKSFENVLLAASL